MVLHACDVSTQEVETKGSGVQSQLWLHSEFKARLGYRRFCLKIKVKIKQVQLHTPISSGGGDKRISSSRSFSTILSFQASLGYTRFHLKSRSRQIDFKHRMYLNDSVLT